MPENDIEVTPAPAEGEVEVQLEPGEGAVATVEPQSEAKKASVPRAKPRDADGKFTAAGEDEAAKAIREAVEAETRRRQAAEATAAAERQRANQADQQRKAREAELQRANEAIESSHLASLDQGIEASKREIASYQNEFKTAMEAGQFEKVAEVQTKLSLAAAALDRLEAKKQDFEANRGQQRPQSYEGRVEEAPATVSATPFEQYVSGFDPQAQAWLRAHPDCVPAQVGGNAQKNAKMMAGHYDALAKGYAANSDEYFKEIEAHLAPPVAPTAPVKSKAEVQDEDSDLPPPPKRQAAPSAPPSREPPGSSPAPGQRRSVRLTPAQQEMAKVSFPHLKTDQERYAAYARNLVELESEGKMGRTTH